MRGNLPRRLLTDSDVRRTLALPEADDTERDPEPTRAFLRAALRDAETIGVRQDRPLARNVHTLGRVCRLTAVERAIVELVATLETDAGLHTCLARRDALPIRDVHRLVGVALNLPTRDVAHALRPRGALRSTQIVGVRVGVARRHEAPLFVLDELVNALDRERLGVGGLIGVFARRARRAELSLDSFAHMREGVALLSGVLRGALRTRARGVNLLLYGDPGTGKTELARALAASLGAGAYHVNDEDSDGDSIDGSGRLRACALAQRMLSRSRRSVLIFDEAEDVFPHEVFSMFGTRQRSTKEKSWMHRLLEDAPLPMIWIANHVDQMDPATLRRFLVAVEMRTPPKAVRARMIERRLARTPVEVAWVERTAADERFTPADAEKVARVARLLGRRPPGQLAHALTQVVDGSLALAGPPRSVESSAGPTPYALRFVNASTDLDSLTRRLVANARGAICLHGPPGTGKTAYVQHVAECVGRPLHSVRGSDVLGMYVGETEQKLARAFRKAASEKAILFLDEVDGLLQERAGAMRSWEVTQVNELLVQVESFAGLLFCATNLVERLDAASLRRFGLKIRFDPLRMEQAVELLTAIAGPVDDTTRERLDRMSGLTAGDFAAAVRHVALLGEPVSAGTLVSALADDWGMKRRDVRAVAGFRART